MLKVHSDRRTKIQQIETNMSIHSLASAQAARRRSTQRQQQPARFWLNRQQQQQGSSEYQHGRTGPSAATDLATPDAHAFQTQQKPRNP
jgi:hypothetical protein